MSKVKWIDQNNVSVIYLCFDFLLVFWGMRRKDYLLLIFTDLYQIIVCFYSISDKYLCGDARNNNAKGFGRKKSTGEIKTGCFYEVSISVRNNCPLGPSHEEDMYFGRLMVICGLCYCKLECLCCSMFLQDGPQKFWLQHTYLSLKHLLFVLLFHVFLQNFEYVPI